MSGSGVAVLVPLTVVSVGSGLVVGAFGVLDVGAMVIQDVSRLNKVMRLWYREHNDVSFA